MSLRINTEWTTRRNAEHKKLVQKAIKEDNKTIPKPLYPELYPYKSFSRKKMEESRKEMFIWKIGIVIISVVVVLFSTIIYLVAMS